MLLVACTAVVSAILSAAEQQVPPVRTARPPDDFSSLAGRWETDEILKQTEGVYLVRLLTIETTSTEIRISPGIVPTAPFRVDGSVTEGSDGLKRSALLVGDGIALTTRRQRAVGGPVNIRTDLYRVTGDVLVIDSHLTVARSDGTIVNIPGSRQVATYRRVR